MTAPVALVTGASSGIGEHTALRLKAAGFEVYGVARRVERMTPLAERGVHVFGMDLTDEESMSTGVERILREQGRLDVLVNNAGYGAYGAVEEVPIEEARRQFEVNLFGLARLTQLVLPTMRAQGSGRVINVSSIGAVIYEPFGAWYHATKFAVDGFSDSLRVELRRFGVDVVLVRPGTIRTEWNEIARTSLVETSSGGPYDRSARKAARTLAFFDRPAFSSGPEAVASVIERAATARRPRTRYAAGRGGLVMPASRRLMPDRAFDAVIGRLFT